MRRYDDSVEVRSGSESATTRASEPSEFLWRGRVYVVREVLAHWIEVGAWWRERDADGLPRPIRTTGREVWRVTAQPGRSGHSGTYDLTCDDLTCDDRDWRLARALD